MNEIRIHEGAGENLVAPSRISRYVSCRSRILSLVGETTSQQVMNKLCSSDVGLYEPPVKRLLGEPIHIPVDRSRCHLPHYARHSSTTKRQLKSF